MLLKKSIVAGSEPRCFRVAAVQMKFADSLAGNLAKVEAALRVAVRRRADAVLFPECATTGYSVEFARLKSDGIRRGLAAVSALAARFHVNVLIGSPVVRGRRRLNTLVVFDRTGRLVHCYAKCQLTELDRRWFSPGDGVALFKLDGVWATAMICHERRYPELPRLGVMAGAQIIFHPNAGMDTLAVSRRKRGVATGSRCGPLRTAPSTFSPIPSVRKAEGSGRQGIRRLSHPTGVCCALQTIRASPLLWRIWICRRQRESTLGKASFIPICLPGTGGRC